MNCAGRVWYVRRLGRERSDLADPSGQVRGDAGPGIVSGGRSAWMVAWWARPGAVL